jgi:hypothetical protein
MKPVFGLNLVDLRRLQEVMIYEEVVNEAKYPIETVHGYKCRNLLQAHDERIRELQRRIMQPHMPNQRILQANYQKIKKTLSLVSQFTSSVRKEAEESKKTALKSKTPKDAHPSQSSRAGSPLVEPLGIRQRRQSLKPAGSRMSIILPPILDRNSRVRTPLKQTRLFAPFKRQPLSTPASIHPIHAAQMFECDEIVNRFHSKGLAVNEMAVRRALLRPEEILHKSTTKKAKKSRRMVSSYSFLTNRLLNV